MCVSKAMHHECLAQSLAQTPSSDVCACVNYTWRPCSGPCPVLDTENTENRHRRRQGRQTSKQAVTVSDEKCIDEEAQGAVGGIEGGPRTQLENQQDR